MEYACVLGAAVISPPLLRFPSIHASYTHTVELYRFADCLCLPHTIARLGCFVCALAGWPVTRVSLLVLYSDVYLFRSSSFEISSDADYAFLISFFFLPFAGICTFKARVRPSSEPIYGANDNDQPRSHFVNLNLFMPYSYSFSDSSTLASPHKQTHATKQSI